MRSMARLFFLMALLLIGKPAVAGVLGAAGVLCVLGWLLAGPRGHWL